MNEKYAEITLDGAGYCYFNGGYSGLFTRNVETCVICIIRYSDRFLLIHDTGQLDIESLTELAMEGGNALSIGVIYGNLAEKIAHEKRIFNLAKSIFISESDIVNIPSEMDKFNVVMDINGGFNFLNPRHVPAGLIEREDNQKIHDIIKFNNFFIEVNAQSITVDFQFNGDGYLSNTTPMHSIEHIIQKMKEQPNFFDLNMLVLYPIIKQSILDSPQWLSDFLYTHVNGTKILTSNLTESQRYRDFIHLASI
ncbi:hypothetical protein WCT80_15460 [Pectobacterium carotovorum]|uniref:hypothetical protein n=1 Tax=Pectobacterium carotovorum TaxID=554 RepID=UPI0030165A63